MPKAPEEKDGKDENYRVLRKTPNRVRSSIPFSEWGRHLARLMPVETSGDVSNDIRSIRDGKKGTRTYRLENQSKPPLLERVLYRIHRIRRKP